MNYLAPAIVICAAIALQGCSKPVNCSQCKQRIDLLHEEVDLSHERASALSSNLVFTTRTTAAGLREIESRLDRLEANRKP